MVTHWLGCPPNGYLGSGYGSGVQDLLQTALSGGGADALIAKLRSDIAIMAQLPASSLNVYAQPSGVDRNDLFIEVAGTFVKIDKASVAGGVVDQTEASAS